MRGAGQYSGHYQIFRDPDRFPKGGWVFRHLTISEKYSTIREVTTITKKNKREGRGVEAAFVVVTNRHGK